MGRILAAPSQGVKRPGIEPDSGLRVRKIQGRHLERLMVSTLDRSYIRSVLCLAASRRDRQAGVGRIWSLALTALVLFTGGCRTEPDYKFGGYIEAEKIEVGSRVGGRVRQVSVDEGDAVTAGQTLVQFESAHLEAQLAAAEHRTERLKIMVDKLTAGPRKQEIEMVRAEVAASQARQRNANSQLSRADEAGEKIYSREQMDNLRMAVDVAAAEVHAKQAQLALLEEGTRPEDLQIARRELEEAQDEALRLADQLNEATVKAPVPAVVEVFDLEPGDLIAGGAPLATLVRTDELWVRCFVPTTLLTFVSVGQTVQVSVDARPGRAFQGRVQRINRVAEYTPRNVQTFEQRQDQVCAVKVQVDDPDDFLRPGMSAVVHVPKTASAVARPNLPAAASDSAVPPAAEPAPQRDEHEPAEQP